MRRVLAILAVGLASAAFVQGGDAKKEKIEGVWTVVSAVKGGEKLADVDNMEVKLIFAGEKLTVVKGGKNEELTYKLDAGQKPKAIDLMPKDKTIKGIYQVDGDTLKICFTGPDDERPTEFVSKEGTRTLLLTLRRDKK
jgi:uncharacterized protein (TIGR03067 family)